MQAESVHPGSLLEVFTKWTRVSNQYPDQETKEEQHPEASV